MNRSRMIKLYYPDNQVALPELDYCKILLALGTRTHYVYFLLAVLDDGKQIVNLGSTTYI